MTINRRLEAHRAASAATHSAKGSVAPLDEPEDPTLPEGDEDAEGKKKDKPMTTVTQAEHEAALAEATNKTAEATNARWNAVLASEEYTGRESLARNLLSTSMDSGAIIAALTSAPKVEASALLTPEQIAAKAEDAARAEMKSAIKDGADNSSVAAVEGGAPETLSKAQQILADQRAFTGAKANK